MSPDEWCLAKYMLLPSTNEKKERNYSITKLNGWSTIIMDLKKWEFSLKMN
jgi:hypothetical protein